MKYSLSTYFEFVYENYSDEFYDSIEWFSDSNIERRWISKLYYKNIDYKLASQIIERAYKINNLNK